MGRSDFKSGEMRTTCLVGSTPTLFRQPHGNRGSVAVAPPASIAMEPKRDAQETGRTRIGTTGWNHPHWRGPVYARDVPRETWLASYASEFDMVEVAGTTHALPEPAIIAEWCAATPEGFRFAVRAPRQITHEKRLKGCAPDLQRLFTRLEAFGSRLGPVVFTLPSRWRLNLPRLAGFLDALPARCDAALEAEDPSWRADEALAMLREHGVSLCMHEREPHMVENAALGRCAFLRPRAPARQDDAGLPLEALRGWAGEARGWNRRGCDAYVVFTAGARAGAVKDARRLRRFLDEDTGAVPAPPDTSPA